MSASNLVGAEAGAFVLIFRNISNVHPKLIRDFNQVSLRSGFSKCLLNSVPCCYSIYEFWYTHFVLLCVDRLEEASRCGEGTQQPTIISQHKPHVKCFEAGLRNVEMNEV